MEWKRKVCLFRGNNYCIAQLLVLNYCFKKFNGEQDVAGFCIFWAIFDRKIKWEKFEKRKIEVLPSRASTRRRAAVKYTYDDNSQDSRYDDDGNMSSEDEQLM